MKRYFLDFLSQVLSGRVQGVEHNPDVSLGEVVPEKGSGGKTSPRGSVEVQRGDQCLTTTGIFSGRVQYRVLKSISDL